jgi:hypothetical protein
MALDDHEKGIGREVVAMHRRGYRPEAIMRTWGITPKMFERMIEDKELRAEARAAEYEREGEREDEYSLNNSGRSLTGGY